MTSHHIIATADLRDPVRPHCQYAVGRNHAAAPSVFVFGQSLRDEVRRVRWHFDCPFDELWLLSVDQEQDARFVGSSLMQCRSMNVRQCVQVAQLPPAEYWRLFAMF